MQFEGSFRTRLKVRLFMVLAMDMGVFPLRTAKLLFFLGDFTFILSRVSWIIRDSRSEGSTMASLVCDAFESWRQRLEFVGLLPTCAFKAICEIL